MRPNHSNNKRMRGRHRNNKPANPLARSYESNGPDVKVRGNPQHIVEKYSQLARDAQVAGDPVLAEAYLQHAEHYYRIISAAHAAMAQAQGFGRPEGPETEEAGDDDDDIGGFQQPYPDFRQQQQTLQQRHDPAEQPQPEGGQPFQRERQPYQDRQDFRPERPDRGERQSFGDRQPYGERQERGDRPDRGERQDRGERRFPPRGPRPDFRPRRQDNEPEAGGEGALPSFITGGAPRSAPANEGESAAPINGQQNGFAHREPAPQAFEGGEARSPYRTRRRRRPADAAPEGAGEGAERSEEQPAD